MKRLFFALAILALGGVQPASADIVIDYAARGSISDTGGPNGNGDINYLAGFANGSRFRNHFDFSIPNFSGTLLAATLTLDNNASPLSHTGGPNTYSVYSLGAFGTYAFTDIGAGTFYATTTISASGTVSMALNNAALNDITAERGLTFSLGGVDSGENSGGSDNFDYGFTNGGRLNPVTLTLVTTTPEPSALVLLGIGVAVMAGHRWLRWRRVAASVAS